MRTPLGLALLVYLPIWGQVRDWKHDSSVDNLYDSIGSARARLGLRPPHSLDRESGGEACWASLLGSLDGIAAQRELALSGAFGTAQTDAAYYVPAQKDDLRVLTFIFDLSTNRAP